MTIWDPKQTLDSIGLGGKKERKRSAKVADAIRVELATLLVSKVRDPELQAVNISRVEVTDDLRIARIFFTVLDNRKGAKSAEKGLQRAKGFMRSHIARTLNLRFTPALQFRYDETAEKVEELDILFQEIANDRKAGDDS
ncbi:MAG: 30S ribosome-binding factor RbfA [Deltaproteobacteria bacterium]|nr:30S ribosome-binding factor RbfA [Deltaproteobacteria bacterium]